MDEWLWQRDGKWAGAGGNGRHGSEWGGGCIGRSNMHIHDSCAVRLRLATGWSVCQRTLCGLAALDNMPMPPSKNIPLQPLLLPTFSVKQILPNNSPALVELALSALNLTGDELVEWTREAGKEGACRGMSATCGSGKTAVLVRGLCGPCRA